MEEMLDTPLAWLAPFRERFKLSAPADQFGDASACESGSLLVLQLSGMVQRLRLEHLEGRPLWVVGVIQRDGSTVLEQDRASISLSPEHMVLLSSAAPIEVVFAGGQASRQTWLVLPAELLRGVCPELALDKPRLLHRAGLHVDMLKAAADLLEQERDCRPSKAGQHVAQAVAHLLAAALAAEGHQEEPARTSLAIFHLARIKQFVLANLRDPELTVRKVSEQLKISPAHIHRVFLSEHQTFGEWLWAQRLAACRAALEQSTHARLSISEIAFSHGFSNSSHFSRAFKARFGMSPSEARNANKHTHKKNRSGL